MVTAAPDTVESHVQDTLIAGAGLCDPDAVRSIVADGYRAVADLIADGVVVVDLRSGAFARNTKLPAGGWSVRVVSEGDDGRRLAVSHWNKLHKGVLIGALIRSMPTLDSVDDLLTWTDQAGFRFEQVGDRQLEFVV